MLGSAQPLRLRWSPAQAAARWRSCLWLGLCVLGSVWRAGAAHTPMPSVPAPRLVACWAPTTASALVPCPLPDPGGPSTTLLGFCPQVESCTALSLFATTWAFYGVLVFGGLCALWWLSTVVRALSPVGTVREPQALGLIVRNFLGASFVFFVAWSLRDLYFHLETMLLAAQQDPTVVPFQVAVYLGEVTLALLVRISLAAWLLRTLFALLKSGFAVTEQSPRALAEATSRLRLMGILLVVILVAPWFLTLVAQLITGWSF